MPTVTNLTKKQVESIQIDEGLVFVDFGLETERKLAPTRGGGEFSADPMSVVDIEHRVFDEDTGIGESEVPP